VAKVERVVEPRREKKIACPNIKWYADMYSVSCGIKRFSKEIALPNIAIRTENSL
jgi:hypothetical protein